jgi:putative redox protein
MTVQCVIQSSGLKLVGYVARPAGPSSASRPPGLVLCHGFPAGPGGAATSGQTYPELAERLAADTGWVVLTFNFRGTGASPGDFSLAAWLDDLRAAVDHLLATEAVSGAWLAGTSTGGALALCEAAEDERVRGVASLSAPTDFGDWARDPEGFLEHARAIGVIRRPAFPPDLHAWARELREIQPLAVVGKIAPRPILLVHGADDDVVPVDNARALADAAGGPEGSGPGGSGAVELRVLAEAGHRLRHDPRAVAVLLGWMERHTV